MWKHMVIHKNENPRKSMAGNESTLSMWTGHFSTSSM